MVDLLSLFLNMSTHTLRKPRRAGRPVGILREVNNRAPVATVAAVVTAARDREKLSWGNQRRFLEAKLRDGIRWGVAGEGKAMVFRVELSVNRHGFRRPRRK